MKYIRSQPWRPRAAGIGNQVSSRRRGYPAQSPAGPGFQLPAAFADDIVADYPDADRDHPATLLGELTGVPAEAAPSEASDLVVSVGTLPAVERPTEAPAGAMLLLTSRREDDDAQVQSPWSA